jgi:uncharacterized membrane protein
MADEPRAEPAHPGERVLGADAGPHRPGDPVWSFRGYQLRPGEFTTAMVHLYRGEVQRSNTWRTRLDSTTNWAVLTTGAALSFALSDPAHHHAVILLNALLVTLFLWIEARRYRYYELWSYRVRLLEIDFFAAMLVPPFTPRTDWADNLASTLLTPRFPITMLEAFGRRCRRNYLWMFLVLDVAWVIKGAIHPSPATAWPVFVDRFGLGPLPGAAVLACGLGYTVALLVLALATAGLRQAGGEVLTEFAGARLISRLWQR